MSEADEHYPKYLSYMKQNIFIKPLSIVVMARADLIPVASIDVVALTDSARRFLFSLMDVIGGVTNVRVMEVRDCVNVFGVEVEMCLEGLGI